MSESNLSDPKLTVSTHDEGHPPQTKPRAVVQTKIQDDDWGTATIYELDSDTETIPPEMSLTVVTRPLTRKSLMSKLLLESVMQGQKADEQEFINEEGWRLAFFPAAFFCTVLEDAITEIRLLTECNTVLRVTKTLTDIGILKAIKYGVEQKEETDDLAGVNIHNLHCEEYKLNKLERDRNIITDMLVRLYIELTIERFFTPLVEIVEDFIEIDEHKAFLIEDEAKNRLALKEVLKQHRIQRNHHKTLLYESESVIGNLRLEVEDASLMAETKGRYVDNWQAARTEQHQQVIFEKEGVFSNSTEYYKRETDHEHRVHSEVESLTNIIIEETLRSVEEWMEKYERDMEKIDLKIQIQKNDYQNMYDKRRDMERTYNRHDRQMREWIRFKEEREEARRYHDTMMKSALTVQAWWRGLLVRKQLGPFRPKKKKGGPPKKK